MKKRNNKEIFENELILEKLGRITKIGYLGISILIAVILPIILTDLLSVFTVSRPYTISDFLYDRIFWISISLIIFIGIKHLRNEYYKTIDQLEFLKINKHKLKRQFITENLKWFFTTIFILFFVYMTILNVQFLLEHPEVVGQSSIIYKNP